MPLSYVVDKERRLVISTGSGRVVFSEILAHQNQLLGDPNFHPEFNQLIDSTAITNLDLSAEEARAAASRNIFSPTSRRAFVANDLAVFGMGRMLASFHELSLTPSQVSVFRDVSAALLWLGEGVPPTPASNSPRAAST